MHHINLGRIDHGQRTEAEGGREETPLTYQTAEE
jgi:hypothetical protein